MRAVLGCLRSAACGSDLGAEGGAAPAELRATGARTATRRALGRAGDRAAGCAGDAPAMASPPPPCQQLGDTPRTNSAVVLAAMLLLLLLRAPLLRAKTM